MESLPCKSPSFGFLPPSPISLSLAPRSLLLLPEHRPSLGVPDCLSSVFSLWDTVHSQGFGYHVPFHVHLFTHPAIQQMVPGVPPIRQPQPRLPTL